MPKKRQRWDALLDHIPADRPIRGAEVGVWEGLLSQKLLAARPLLSLHLVDRWRAPEPDDSYASSGAITASLPQERYDLAYATTKARMMPYVIAKRVSIRKSDSWDAGRSYETGYFDFVFLDGDHSYVGMWRDLSAWGVNVKRGGFVCGHDYGRPDQGEVKRAVDEFYENREIETGDAWTWFVRVPT